MTAKEYLSPDEIKTLLERSDLKAWVEMASTWGWIAFAFALSGLLPDPLTIIISLWILGGKQLGCAIIMHDTSHYALFESKEANERWGNWLGGYPIFIDLRRYRPYHMQHHVRTGREDDPDLLLTRGYPTSKASMARKFLRDLTGITGIKAFFGLMLMHAGLLRFNLGNKVEWLKKEERRGLWHLIEFVRNLSGPLVANALIFSIVWFVGAPWLYLLWIGAYLTTYQFCLRVRSIAEHSVVPDQQDDHRNSRTTYANFLEKLLFAPHNVNYHAEHHLLMTVPPYNLPKMHDKLKANGYFNVGLLEPGYLNVLRSAVK